MPGGSSSSASSMSLREKSSASSASPHATPHASPSLSSSNGGGAASHAAAHSSSLVRALLNVMWHAETKARTSCSHLRSGIDLAPCEATVRKPDSWCCEACETSNAVRMCLCCGSCACERHSYAHFEEKAAHSLWMQLNAESKPVFCYACRTMVREEDSELESIRDTLEQVQTLNIDILTSKTTRSGRKRIDAAAAAAAAAEAESDALPSAMRPGADPDADMVDPNAPPPDLLRLTRQASLVRVKTWQQAMPFLSKKAQAQRRQEDQLRTVLFRWRNRALVSYFNSWKYVMRTGRDTRPARKAALRKSGAKPAAMHIDDVPMTSFDLSKMDTEEAGAEEPAGVTRSRRKKGTAAAASPALGPTTRRTRASSPAPESPERPKRSRSEERHAPRTTRASKETKQSADDLLSPKIAANKRSRSARGSPDGSRSMSPTAGKAPGGKGAVIKLAPGIMGLRNLGNTCYLNSVVQALSLTSSFKSYYVEEIPKHFPPLKHNERSLLNSRAAKNKKKHVSSDAESSDASDDDDGDDHSSLTRDFSELLGTIWKGQRIMFTPDHFLQTVWTLYERFKGFKQQDAQEFVLFLLNQLSKEQEQQMAAQKLNAKFKNPALDLARSELSHGGGAEKTSAPAAAAAAPTGRKRKTNNVPSAAAAAEDAESESAPVKRRSGRSATVSSTSSSNSISKNEAPPAPASSSGQAASSYNTPLPPSSLASVEVRSSAAAAAAPFSVPRMILSRENDFIVQNFAGVIRSEIKCTPCGRISATESDFLGMISVQIPSKSFLDPEEDAPVERSASMQHSASVASLAGGSASSVSVAAPSTLLSVSRSIGHSRSEHSISALPPPAPVTPVTDTPAARNKVRHTSVTLQKCLAFTFNQPEVMDGANAYNCSGCKQKVRAERYQVIQALPPQYLFLHVGRTVYDTSSFSSKKDQTHIAFPLSDLDLAPFLPASCAKGEWKYDLYAVVNHHGRGLNEGHFTSFGYSEQQDVWMLFNDARVNVVTPDKVAESQAYLLFYKRQEKRKA